MRAPAERNPEQNLIDRAKAGDISAFADLAESCRLRLFRRAIVLTGNATDGEDLLQEAFVSAFESLHTFQGKSSFYTWIYTILNRRAIDRYRKMGKGKGEKVLELPGSLEDGTIRIPEEFEKTEEQTLIRQAVHALPARYRNLVIMHYFEELSIAEMGEILGQPEGTIKSSLFRAREILAKEPGIAAMEDPRNG